MNCACHFCFIGRYIKCFQVFPKSFFSKRQLPKSVLPVALSPSSRSHVLRLHSAPSPSSPGLCLYCSLRRLRRSYLTLGKFRIWEVAPLEKYIPYENTVGKIPNTIQITMAVCFKLQWLFVSGSIYLTLAISIERYTTVCHPFFKVS